MDLNEALDFVVPFAERLPMLRGIIGFIAVFFLPGFAWTFVFFKRVSAIERIVLGMGLSIAIVTMSVLVLHLSFGMTITGINSLVTIAIIIAGAVAVYYIKKYMIHRTKTGEN